MIGRRVSDAVTGRADAATSAIGAALRRTETNMRRPTLSRVWLLSVCAVQRIAMAAAWLATSAIAPVRTTAAAASSGRDELSHSRGAFQSIVSQWGSMDTRLASSAVSEKIRMSIRRT